jgi:hypothetical protein
VIVHLQVDEHRYVEDKGEDGHRDNVQREMFEPPVEKNFLRIFKNFINKNKFGESYKEV